MNRAFLRILLLCGLFWVSQDLSAEANPKTTTKKLSPAEYEQWFKRIDRAESEVNDIKAMMEIELVSKEGQRRSRKAVLFQSGTDKRLVQFKTPASEAGITVLVNGPDIHLYLPRFDNVRRLAAHVRNQPFMGSDLSFDDMGSIEYSKSYKVTSGESMGEKILLVLTPKGSSTYSKLHAWIEQKRGLLLGVDYFDKQGKNHKSMKRVKFEKMKSYHIPTESEVKDVLSEHRTFVRLTKVQVDTGISSRFFTLRYLKRELDL